MRKKKTSKSEKLYVGIFCKYCGFIHENVSIASIKAILALTHQSRAFITCRKCGSEVEINLENDILKIDKNGKIKLPEKTQW